MTSVKTRPGYSKAQKKRTYIKVPRILAMSHLIWIKKVSLPRTRYRLKRLVFLNWLRCFDYFLKNNGLQHSLLLSPVLDYMQPKETTSSPYFQSSLAQGGAHRKSFTSHSLVVNPRLLKHYHLYYRVHHVCGLVRYGERQLACRQDELH